MLQWHLDFARFFEMVVVTAISFTILIFTLAASTQKLSAATMHKCCKSLWKLSAYHLSKERKYQFLSACFKLIGSVFNKGPWTIILSYQLLLLPYVAWADEIWPNCMQSPKVAPQWQLGTYSLHENPEACAKTKWFSVKIVSNSRPLSEYLNTARTAQKLTLLIKPWPT